MYNWPGVEEHGLDKSSTGRGGRGAISLGWVSASCTVSVEDSMKIEYYEFQT